MVVIFFFHINVGFTSTSCRKNQLQTPLSEKKNYKVGNSVAKSLNAKIGYQMFQRTYDMTLKIEQASKFPQLEVHKKLRNLHCWILYKNENPGLKGEGRKKTYDLYIRNNSYKLVSASVSNGAKLRAILVWQNSHGNDDCSLLAVYVL